MTEAASTNGHDPATGKFIAGNGGGPGRPRAIIEADVRRAVRDAISLDNFRKIIDKCVLDALAGDSRARHDILMLMLGDGPLDLTGLAVMDLAGIETPELVSAAAELQAEQAAGWSSPNTPLDFAIVRRVRLAEERKEKEREAAEELQREQDRIKRATRKAAHDAERAASKATDGTEAQDGRG